MTSTDYGGSPCDATNTVSKIVEDYLVPHEDGLPKPQYCLNNGVYPQDPRCGWILPQSSNDAKKASTSGPDSFHSWFRDVPTLNLRAGFTLTLNPFGVGQFRFASTAFFPFASQFGVGLKPCLATADKRLNCANGGKAFPVHDKIDGDDSASRIFSFSSEHHSFFQLKGTEKFEFSGVSSNYAE